MIRLCLNFLTRQQLLKLGQSEAANLAIAQMYRIPLAEQKKEIMFMAALVLELHQKYSQRLKQTSNVMFSLSCICTSESEVRYTLNIALGRSRLPLVSDFRFECVSQQALIQNPSLLMQKLQDFK